ncbi:MAG: RNA polymerase sigma factor [Bacteroidota bacterium]
MDQEKQTAFMDAYNPCHDAFIRYCSALAYGKMELDDFVQEILLSAYKHFDKIRKKDQFLHYLIRAARFYAINRGRKKKLEIVLHDQHAEKLRSQGVEPEMLLDIQLMYRMLDQLPVKQKEAIILFEISGFSMKEIAKIQHSSPGGVKTKISRGRKKLAKMMEERSHTHSIGSILGTIQMLCL